jgi:hypothetical protein
VAIPIDLLAIPDVDTRKRSLHLPALARDPVDLVALYLVGCGCLDRVIVESDQIETLPLVVTCRRLWLRLRLWWWRRLPLTLTVSIVLRDGRWWRGIRTTAVRVRIVAVVIRIVSVRRVTGIIIGIIGVPPATKSEVASVETAASIETAASVISSASEASATTEGATAGESASGPATTAGESASGTTAASVPTSSTSTTMATAALGISWSKQKRRKESDEKR